MELADDGIDERQELLDVRERCFDFLWNYSEYKSEEHEVNTPGSSIEESATTFPYRCVGMPWPRSRDASAVAKRMTR